MDTGTHGRCASPGMNFNINPSLVSRAAISVTAALWYHEDILNPDKRYRLPKNYKTHEDKVADNAKSLLIPETLKENILASIRHVKNQLEHWIEIHGEGFYDVCLYNDFCWTSIGSIDFTKTACNIIRRGGLTPIKAFKLACISWSVEHVYEFWPLVRKNFNKNRSFSQQGIDFWVRYLQDTFQTPNTYPKLPTGFSKEGFHLAWFYGNVSALRLLEEQNLEGRKDVIQSAQSYLTFSVCTMKPHAILFFLSYMDATQQDKFLKRYPAQRLILFLKWPLRHFFLQLADKLWECCTVHDFCKVISVLTRKIRLHKKEAVIYESLFIDFWKRSPLELRNYYIENVFVLKFRNIWLSFRIDNDLNIPYSGVYEKILFTTFLCDANASLYFILKGKPRAVRALFRKSLGIRPKRRKKFSDLK